MDIRKLTINPTVKGHLQIVILEPRAELAGTLIKERLSTRIDNDKPARIFRKIPKFLKGLVNPKTKVSSERRFTMNG